MAHRREAIIHIGTHKTGTTSFQRALWESRDELSAAGVALVADMPTGQCLSLANEGVRDEMIFPGRVLNPNLLLTESRVTSRQWLREQFASRAPIAIASHEALSLVRTASEARRVRRLLDGRRGRIVVVVREPADYLRSWAAQLRNMGFPTSSSYASSFMNVAPDSWLVNTDQLVRSYRSVFGRESVTVLRYEELLTTGSSTRGLWSACGLPDPSDPSVLDDRSNVTSDMPEPPPTRPWPQRFWD